MLGRELAFNQLFTAEDIAESLVSVSIDETGKIEEYFEDRNYDVIGYQENGQVIGFLERGKVIDFSNLQGSMAKFKISDLITNNTNLMDCLRILNNKSHLFVINKSKVESIVTMSDIQKPAVRMLFFGVVTFFESTIANLIHEKYPNDEWKSLLNTRRIDMAIGTYQDLIKRNQEINLINCTQLCDKTDIIYKKKELLKEFIEMSNKDAKEFFKRTNDFRNDIAHAQSLTSWFEEKDVIRLVDNLIRITEVIVERDTHLNERRMLEV